MRRTAVKRDHSTSFVYQENALLKQENAKLHGIISELRQQIEVFKAKQGLM